MKKTITKIRAFTLIELLIVVAIIAILTSIVLASLSNAKLKARDGKRISDIGQIQLALEQFFDRCQVYPAALDLGQNCVKNSQTIYMSNFISKIPTQPSGVNYDYAFRSDNLDYVLRATLEASNNEALNDAMLGFPTAPGSMYYTPSTLSCVPANKEYCVGPK